MKKVIKISIVTIVFAFALVCFAGGKVAKAEEQTTTNVPETTTHKKTKAKKISLSAPKLKIKKHYEKHIKLDWNDVDKAQNYRVLRARKGKSFTLIKKTNKSSFTDKKVKKRTTPTNAIETNMISNRLLIFPNSILPTLMHFISSMISRHNR